MIETAPPIQVTPGKGERLDPVLGDQRGGCGRLEQQLRTKRF